MILKAKEGYGHFSSPAHLPSNHTVVNGHRLQMEGLLLNFPTSMTDNVLSSPDLAPLQVECNYALTLSHVLPYKLNFHLF